MSHVSGWIGTLTSASGDFATWRLALTHFELVYRTRVHPIRVMGASFRFGAKGQSEWNAICRFIPQDNTVAADITVGDDATIELFHTAGRSWNGTCIVEQYRMVSPVDSVFTGEALLYGNDVLEFDSGTPVEVMPGVID